VPGAKGTEELVWDKLTYYRTIWVLGSPRYAGAYGFGRTRSQKLPSGKSQRTKKKLPPEQWYACIPNAHAGYIGWEEFQQNQKVLQDNATQYRCQRQRTPPREGPSLIQGLVICGKCGRRMQVQYHERRGHLYPDYICGATAARQGLPQCQRVPGRSIDKAVSDLLLETVTPLNIDVALAVQQELQSRFEEVDRLRQQTVQRAQQEAELARRRYMQVDPDNRLVADQLEADWNGKLRALRGAQDEYQKQKEADQKSLSAEQRQKVLALAADFPKVWNDPNLPDRERKRVARLLLEDVTLRKEDQVVVQVRFKGGALRTLELPLPQPYCVLFRTRPEIIEEIDRLLGSHEYEEIAQLLNERGLRSSEGRLFNVDIIGRICKDSKLKSRRQRLLEAGMFTRKQIAHSFKVSDLKITPWRQKGWIIGHRSNYKTEFLYEAPTAEQIAEVKAKQRNEKRIERQGR
jgi:hypothetical protein